MEDDPVGGRQLAQFLRSFGYQVTLVTGQAAALERLAVQPLQGAIIDLTLTDGDGYGVLEAVRARDPLIPIICTSGQSDLSARVLGLKAGFDHYLGKPFEPLELEALLTAALRSIRCLLWPQPPRHHGVAPASQARTPDARAAALQERLCDRLCLGSGAGD